MVKLSASFGSGASKEISGWLPILYPYLKGGEANSYLRPWQEMYFSGPDPDNIPPIQSSAPVDWDYYGTTYNLHFSAGFVGCTQDPSDGTLCPTMGWYVTHDPPSEPQKRLQVIDAEIKALVKGHSEEAHHRVLKMDAPWFVRVSVLFVERQAILETLYNNLEKDESRIQKEQNYSWYSRSEKEDLKKRLQKWEEARAKLDSVPKYDAVEVMVLGDGPRNLIDLGCTGSRL